MPIFFKKGSTLRPGNTIVLGAGLTATEDSSGLLQIDTASGGSVGGGGTPNRLARWTSSVNLGDSLLSDDATNVTLTSGDLIFSAAASRIRPGATSLSLRNNANSADNILIADSGAITFRAGLSGITTLSMSGTLTLTAAASKVVPGATSLALRNNADSADNILIADSGAITFRAGLSGITTLSMSGQLTSTLSTGTAPFVVASTTKVTNLNADQLDGLDSTAFLQTSAINGSAGTIVKYATSSTLGNSIITESGSVITINGGLTLSSQQLLATALTQSPTANANGVLVSLGGTLTEAGTGTHARMSLLELAIPTVTNAGAAVTDATTLYIAGAPSATSATNRALWVAAGASRFGGAVTLDSTLALGAAVTATTDNSYDLGATGANRLRSIYVSDSLVAEDAANTVRMWMKASSAGRLETISNHNLRLGTNGTARWEIDTTGHITPVAANSYNIGGSGSPAATVYANNLAITATTGRITVGSTGVSSNVGIRLRSEAVLTGATSQYGMYSDATYDSGATLIGVAGYFRVNTQAAAFTMTDAMAVRALAPVIGSGSAITNAYGLYVDSITGGGTSNYAIYTNTGGVRLGDAVGIGANPGTNVCLLVQGTVATTISNTTQVGTLSRIIGNSTGTSSVEALRADPRVDTATATSLIGVRVMGPTFTNSGAATTMYGLKVEDQTLGGTNYSIYTGLGLVRFGGATTIASGGLTITTGGLTVSAGNSTLSGHLLFTTDNSWDIGASGATRPRTLYIGTSIDQADNSGQAIFRAGNVVIGDTTIAGSSLNLALRSEAAKNRQLLWYTGANARWMMRANNTAEGGSDAGSNFDLYRYNDAGSTATLVMQIRRSDGRIAIGTDAPLASPSDALMVLQASSTGTGALSMAMVGYGNNTAGIRGLMASGTYASPTAISNAGVGYLNFLGGSGYDGTTWQTGSAALFGIKPAGTWSGSSRPTQLTFEVTDTSSTTRNIRMTMLSNGDLQLATLGTIDNQTAPTKDYSLVYNGATSKWTPRLVNAFVASAGAVGASQLIDATQAAYVNTQPSGLSGSGAPSTPGTPTIVQGYRCMIVTAPTASANQLYAWDWTNNCTYYATRFSITTGTGTLTVTGGTPNTFVAGDVGRYVAIAGAGSGGATLWAKITAYTSATQVTVSPNAGTTVSSANGYIGSFKELDQRACTTGSTTTTVVASAPGWTDGQWRGYQVVMITGSLSGQVRTILDNTTTTLIISATTPWASSPANLDQFAIAPLFTSADTFVHANLTEGDTMWYRYKTIGGSSTYMASAFGPSTVPTGGTVVSGVSYVNAFGLVVASQLAVTNLAAITATTSVLGVGTGAADLFAVRKLYASANVSSGNSAVDTSVNHLMIDGATLYGRTGATPPTNDFILGDHSVTIGTLTARQASSWSNNNPSTAVTAPTGGTWIEATTKPTLSSDITTNLPAYDNLYYVSGNLTLNPSGLTSATVVGFQSMMGRVTLEYRTSSGGSWVSVGEVASVSLDLGDASTAITWQAAVYITGTPTALNFRLTYGLQLNASKVLSGSLTVSGTAGVAGTTVDWQTSSGSSYARRNLRLGATTSRAQITFDSVGTQPTTSNSVAGELWFNSTNAALRLNDGTQIVSLGAASTGQEGVIKLAGDLAGTYLLPKVNSLGTSGTSVNVGSASAPGGSRYTLITTAATAAAWTTLSSVVNTYSWEAKRHVIWYKYRTGAATFLGYGAYAGNNGTSGAGSSIAISTTPADGQVWAKFTAGSGSGNYATVVSAGSGGGTAYEDLYYNSDPVMVWHIRTGTSTERTGLRAYMGLTTALQTNATATGDFVGVRLSGQTLVLVTVKGSGTENVSGTVATLSDSTEYTIKIRVDSAGQDVYASVNGGAETSLLDGGLGRFPNTASTACGMHFIASDTNADGNASALYLATCSIEYGT